MDRYYQIAKCLRDEDLRADRQFEFAQLDAEASFVGQEEVIEFISYAIAAATDAVRGVWPEEIPQMTYADAMEFYGSDKPDIRFGMTLVELTPLFEGTEANVFKTECVKGIVAKNGADEIGRNRIDELTDMCKKWGAKGLAWFRVGAGLELDGGLTKFMSADELSGLPQMLGAEEWRPDPAAVRRPAVRQRCARPSAAGTRATPSRRRPGLCLGCRLPHVRSHQRRRRSRSPCTTRSPCRTPTMSTTWCARAASPCSRSGPRPMTWC